MEEKPAGIKETHIVEPVVIAVIERNCCCGSSIRLESDGKRSYEDKQMLSEFSDKHQTCPGLYAQRVINRGER